VIFTLIHDNTTKWTSYGGGEARRGGEERGGDPLGGVKLIPLAGSVEKEKPK
jgi:hypothetical protein